MAIENYYRTLTLKRPSQSVDDYGDTVTTHTVVGAFQGHVGEPTSKQVQRAAQRGIDVSGRLYAPVSAGVKAYDIIIDGDKAYEVKSEPRDAANRGHHVEADLTELRGGIS